MSCLSFLSFFFLEFMIGCKFVQHLLFGCLGVQDMGVVASIKLHYNHTHTRRAFKFNNRACNARHLFFPPDKALKFMYCSVRDCLIYPFPSSRSLILHLCTWSPNSCLFCAEGMKRKQLFSFSEVNNSITCFPILLLLC